MKNDLNDFNEGLDYYIDDNNQIVDLSTGMILEKDKLRKAYKDKIISDFKETSKECIELNLGLNFILREYKGIVYNFVSIKKGYGFGKVFRVSVRELMKEGKLSKNAKIFIATFEPYISFPHNTVVVDGSNPNVDIMSAMLDLKRSAIYYLLKELEEKQVIKKVKLNGDNIIYFNPFLYCSGGVTTKETYEYFKDSIYNPNNKFSI